MTFGTDLVATHTFDTFTLHCHALNDLALHDGVHMPHSEPFASVKKFHNSITSVILNLDMCENIMFVYLKMRLHCETAFGTIIALMLE